MSEKMMRLVRESGAYAMKMFDTMTLPKVREIKKRYLGCGGIDLKEAETLRQTLPPGAYDPSIDCEGGEIYLSWTENREMNEKELEAYRGKRFKMLLDSFVQENAENYGFSRVPSDWKLCEPFQKEPGKLYSLYSDGEYEEMLPYFKSFLKETKEKK